MGHLEFKKKKIKVEKHRSSQTKHQTLELAMAASRGSLWHTLNLLPTRAQPEEANSSYKGLFQQLHLFLSLCLSPLTPLLQLGALCNSSGTWLAALWVPTGLRQAVKLLQHRSEELLPELLPSICPSTAAQPWCLDWGLWLQKGQKEKLLYHPSFQSLE